ncbi:MAG: tolB protein precursor, periplasmic protein involved in the tonb-independent uptake of group A colicins [uncultured Thermomicrobiales bacterium]|uniref:TolB protein, periplasmic protein involved in the tonb-independent uptake of group A colicins n=1 Tax=uncultured Thermomicrobiales bacterium TaxID=1645740 RepID=A0A6J4UY65_9BACT|nr:MAG: tolB protein precursor, periplasmic protein involved in the tonb-independent uptake of group A colicins [uncultured Thermomicrobiales bacterium]
MFCIACATLNPVAARRCARCGGGLGATPAVAARRAKRQHVVGRVLLLVPVLALLAGGGVGVARFRADRADLAAGYAAAEAALERGSLDEAIASFGAVGGYRDADDRRAETVAALAPYRLAYLDGMAALDAGRHDAAIAALLPVARDLPSYKNAPDLLAAARAGRAEALLAQAALAESRRDWLAAERALATLAAFDPDDDALAARLAALRQTHAPVLVTRDHALLAIGPDLADERVVVDEVPVRWPVWSPDRTRIAFISTDRADLDVNKILYTVDADGGGLTRLADRIHGDVPPVWSPDGTRIAYTHVTTYDSTRGMAFFGIHAVDVATGQDHNLTGEADLPNAQFPVWSPTGDRIAFLAYDVYTSPGEGTLQRDGEVYVLTLATGDLVNLTAGRLPEASRVAWSPVSDRLLVWTQHAGAWYEPQRSTIRALDARTGVLTDVESRSQSVHPPVWSPDGARFAFVQGEREVRVRTAGTRGELFIPVPTPLHGFVTWSPDGEALIAAALDPTQPSYLIPVPRGGPPGTLVPLLLAFDPAVDGAGPPQWSPTHLAPAPGPPTVGGTGLDRD